MRDLRCLLGVLVHAAWAQPPDAAQLSRQAAPLVAQGRYAEAEPLLEGALVLQERASGPDDLSLVPRLGALAGLYRAQGRNEDAQKLYARSLAIHEKAGSNPLDLIPDLKLLAAINAAMGKNTDAELAYLRVLALREKANGLEDLDLAGDCADLAGFYIARKRFAVAEANLRRAIAIIEKKQGTQSAALLPVFDSLVAIYLKESKFEMAESPLRHEISIEEGSTARNMRTSRRIWIAWEKCISWRSVMPMRSRCMNDRFRFGRQRSARPIPKSRPRSTISRWSTPRRRSTRKPNLCTSARWRCANERRPTA